MHATDAWSTNFWKFSMKLGEVARWKVWLIPQFSGLHSIPCLLFPAFSHIASPIPFVPINHLSSTIPRLLSPIMCSQSNIPQILSIISCLLLTISPPIPYTLFPIPCSRYPTWPLSPPVDEHLWEKTPLDPPKASCHYPCLSHRTQLQCHLQYTRRNYFDKK